MPKPAVCSQPYRPLPSQKALEKAHAPIGLRGRAARVDGDAEAEGPRAAESIDGFET